MLKNLLACLLFVSISGCSLLHVHQSTIEQGNIIEASKLQKIKNGMTKDEVKAILGTPMLKNYLDASTVVYVYTLQVANTKMAEKKISLDFTNGRLQNWGSMQVQ